MNIKVITRHTPSNYGSLLQAMATQTVLRQIGHECQIIDYRRSSERGLRSVSTALSAKKDWNGSLFKKWAYIALRYPTEKIAEIKFDSLRRTHLDMTCPIDSNENLSGLKADVFMTGSDQVWGVMPDGSQDDAYFLDFVKSGPRVAYAASFGKSEEYSQHISNLLSRYDSITVRENRAVEMLVEMGLPAPEQVLDPTLLLDAGEWSKFIRRKDRGKYILVYQIHNNPLLNDFAKKVAKIKKLPLLRVSPFMHQIFRAGKLRLLPNVGEFLGLIRDAELMVTDSFHGTAFAINFNTDFVEFLPNNNTSSRNQSILQHTNLTDRIVTDPDDTSIIDKKIDYSPVNDIISAERKHSLEVLRCMIEG